MKGRKLSKWYLGRLVNGLLGRKPAQLFWIHPPKTAGVSFFPVLEANYGMRQTFRINFGHLPEDQQEKQMVLAKTFNGFPVVGGHLPYNMARPHLKSYTRIITWVRHPVDRVISNYRYSHRNWVRDGKPIKTVEDYISREYNQNRLWQYLNGVDLETLYFVGLVEYYEEDLRELGRMLGWKQVSVRHDNRSEGAGVVLTDSIRDAILKYNAKDVAIYEKAVEIRGKRTQLA